MFEKVRDVLAEQLEVDRDDITPETNIVEDLGADSLDIVEMLTTLENDLGIIITDESIINLHTVGDVAAFIETLV
ncbi:MAG: acyl carrier protein [Oscillospiraceae bacterium]|nr:acyl carrier protein [Oscillospiraceae bacterium]